MWHLSNAEFRRENVKRMEGFCLSLSKLIESKETYRSQPSQKDSANTVRLKETRVGRGSQSWYTREAQCGRVQDDAHLVEVSQSRLYKHRPENPIFLTFTVSSKVREGTGNKIKCRH